MKNSKHDIQNTNDVKLMVDSFYEKVNQNELLSYVFNDFSKVDWETHLPKMYRFWNSMIFGEQTYEGNPFAAHISLPINKQHFDNWLQLFMENMDELFEGEVAEQVKFRAKSIAQMFQNKLEIVNK